MTMKQVVTQLHQELFTQSSSGSKNWTCRCSASDQHDSRHKIHRDIIPLAKMHIGIISRFRFSRRP